MSSYGGIAFTNLAVSKLLGQKQIHGAASVAKSFAKTVNVWAVCTDDSRRLGLLWLLDTGTL